MRYLTSVNQGSISLSIEPLWMDLMSILLCLLSLGIVFLSHTIQSCLLLCLVRLPLAAFVSCPALPLGVPEKHMLPLLGYLIQLTAFFNL